MAASCFGFPLSLAPRLVFRSPVRASRACQMLGGMASPAHIHAGRIGGIVSALELLRVCAESQCVAVRALACVVLVLSRLVRRVVVVAEERWFSLLKKKRGPTPEGRKQTRRHILTHLSCRPSTTL